MPHVDQARPTTRTSRRSPPASRAMSTTGASILAPQPWNETHLKFYYQMQAEVGQQITRVLDALRDTEAYENTIVVFSSDHGDMQGAHGGMHEKWHVAYEETITCRSSSPARCCPAAPASSTPDQPRRPPPTLLGLAGIDPDEALSRLQSATAKRARSSAATSPGDPCRRTGRAHGADPVMTDDEISEGSATTRSPFGRSPRRCSGTRPSSSRTTSRPSSPRSTSTASPPRQVLPLLRQRPVLDRSRRA